MPYSNVMPSSYSYNLLTIGAEADPQAPARVLGLVTRQNLLPRSFSMRCQEPAALRIEMELDGFGAEAVKLLALRIANIPSVLGVARITMKRRRTTHF